MLFSKTFQIAVFIAALTIVGSAQTPDPIVASANGVSIKMSELPPDVRALLDRGNAAASELQVRTQMYEEFVNRRMLHHHFDKTGKTVTDIFSELRSKARTPTENEINGTIAANREALAQFSEAEGRQRVVDHLRSQTVRTAYSALLSELKTQYRVTPATNAAAPGKRPTDTVLSIDGKAITASEFDTFVQLALNDRKHHRFHTAEGSIEQLLFGQLLEKEASSLGIASNVLMQREVSSKLQTFTDEEIEAVNAAFRSRLFTKYNAKVTLPDHGDLKIEIPLDGSPTDGPANAPVTIVMFSDFQCSACSATAPLLKKIADDFPGKVRIVTKYFPLESIHEHAFVAARAAFAAGEQGKFNEYTALLYRDRESLSSQRFEELASSIGLNVERFRADRNSARSLESVRRDLVFGDSIGILGTPTLLVNGSVIFDISEKAILTAVAAYLK